MDARAKALKAEGKDLVSFTAGEPDFDTPDPIKEAGIAAIRKGQTKYTPASGTVELRKAVCEKLKRDNGLDYAPDQVIIGCGAKHVLYTFFQAVLDPGDRVLIPTPYWVSYPEQVKLAGGIPAFIETTPQEGFLLSPEKLQSQITNHNSQFTKVLVLNSPSNPTGAVYPPDHLRKLAEIADKAGMLIVSDEIYEKLIYGLPHASPAAFGLSIYNRTVTVNGVSKSYAMTGWRIGYAAGPKEIIDAMGRIQSHETSNPTSIAQAAALEALRRGDQDVTPMVEAFRKRRDLILSLLSGIRGVVCPKPEGAFYVFPDLSAYLSTPPLTKGGQGGVPFRNSDDLSLSLLSDCLVAVVSGVGFGAPTCLRLSYAVSEKDIERGLDRLVKYFKNFA
ncbi:MAG: hypothetical protein A3G34_00250 [Candidatus Lindowbacteria bacterium RIFCSPLOWO2_12_FULL_62_27]|nr:MAG: hypothetical protein A3G34_00250 [Candidatus Lindowbacteria bacterium RIFCSPLOWO2_12_FULL_62_27]OGH63421.1 MAG: hypothetical protein A3I06_08320 [Candidatus Lindowbacteria bacterium RIFCSPLOWO2_02_FULL_62_12]